MAAYICAVCDTVYDEDKEGVKWDDLPDDWVCPVCDYPKSMFKLAEDSSPEAEAETTASVPHHADMTPADVPTPAIATVSDLMVATMVNWGILTQ